MSRAKGSRYGHVMKNIFYLFWIIRVPIVSVSILLLMDAFSVSGIKNVLIPCISTMCMLFSGYVINDILDADIDRISAPDRPIPSGNISLNGAKAIFGIFESIAFIFSVLSQNAVFTSYIAIYAVMFWIYTKYLKRNWLIKNGVTALFFSSLALIPIIFDKGAFASVMPLFIVSFVFTLGREILMDMKDLVGDSIILDNKRMKAEIGLVISTALVSVAFILMELFYFDTYIVRYITIAVVCLVFVSLLCRKKRKIWLYAEVMKLWFLINLLFLYFEI